MIARQMVSNKGRPRRGFSPRGLSPDKMNKYIKGHLEDYKDLKTFENGVV